MFSWRYSHSSNSTNHLKHQLPWVLQWSTQSKALGKSMKITPTLSQLSSALFLSHWSWVSLNCFLETLKRLAIKIEECHTILEQTSTFGILRLFLVIIISLWLCFSAMHRYPRNIKQWMTRNERALNLQPSNNKKFVQTDKTKSNLNNLLTL